MAPLDEFVVTAKNFGPKPKMEWHDWYVSARFPEYTMVDGYKLHFETQKEPDFDIIMPDHVPPYQLVWAKD